MIYAQHDLYLSGGMNISYSVNESPNERQNIKNRFFMEELITEFENLRQLLDESGANAQAKRRESIESCISSLVHAVKCRDANCMKPTCSK